MATTKIWKIGDRIDHVIEYATNKDKTAKNLSDLYQAINYTTNENKTVCIRNKLCATNCL